MNWLALTCLYLFIHLLLYLLVLRHTRAFDHERVIFLYHLVSLGLVALVLSVFVPGWLVTLEPAPSAALAMHCIYSLTFLELWSLAQGSYSLTILGQIVGLRAAGRATGIPELLPVAAVGASKRRQRVNSLQRLRLVRWHGERLELTWPGRVVAVGLGAIAWTARVDRVDRSDQPG